MPEHGLRDFHHILKPHHVTTIQRSSGFGTEDQILHGTRASTPAHERLQPRRSLTAGRTRLSREIDGEFVNVIRHGNASDEVLKRQHLGSIHDVLELRHTLAGGAFGNGDFFIAARVIDADHEHEAVELGFGQRVGAFLFDGVLGGEHEERRIQGVGAAGDGDFVLLHRLEHGGLRFGGGAVDFIGEDDVREHRALGEFESAFTAGEFLQNVGAGDVHGHQIGRELDAAEAQAHCFGQA